MGLDQWNELISIANGFMCHYWFPSTRQTCTNSIIVGSVYTPPFPNNALSLHEQRHIEFPLLLLLPQHNSWVQDSQPDYIFQHCHILPVNFCCISTYLSLAIVIGLKSNCSGLLLTQSNLSRTPSSSQRIQYHVYTPPRVFYLFTCTFSIRTNVSHNWMQCMSCFIFIRANNVHVTRRHSSRCLDNHRVGEA